MTIKIDLTARGVDEMMDVLKHFPDLAEKHYRPAVNRDVDKLRALVDVPRGATGRAASTFGAKVTGRGFGIKGLVGWYDKGDPYYPNVLEYGARPHLLNKGASIRSSKRSFAAFKSLVTGDFSAQQKGAGGGMHVLVKGAWKTMKRHPGMPAMKFMASAYSTLQPVIENDLYMANERILADLAVIGK